MTSRILVEQAVLTTDPIQTEQIAVSSKSTSHYVIVRAPNAGTLVTEMLAGSTWVAYSSDPTVAAPTANDPSSAFTSQVGGPHRFRWIPDASGGVVLIIHGEMGNAQGG